MAECLLKKKAAVRRRKWSKIMSLDRMIEKIVETGNPTVAGLDPKLDYLPSYLKEEAFALCGKKFKRSCCGYFELQQGAH